MTNEEKVIKPKLGLLRLAEELGNVSAACKVMGYSRDSFYRFKQLFEKGGELALREISRRKPILSNRVAPEVEEAAVAYALEQPAHGPARASNELKKRGVFVSPSGLRGIWQRNDLDNFRKRLKALEAKAAQDHFILTEAQVAAMEKAKAEKEACGEIETEHPGYLGSQDTYFVGTMKGVGRIYQQTFVDTYTKVAFAKLYTGKTALLAADLLNDRVLPFFEGEGLALLRILTDRGSEYCGNIAHHEYQLYLAVEGIDHTRTKARHPQTNGICERLHRTMKDEFYAVAFRTKVYTSLDELQADLDAWIQEYNEQRTHSGRYCYGKTPLQTWKDAKHLALEKQIPGASQGGPCPSQQSQSQPGWDAQSEAVPKSEGSHRETDLGTCTARPGWDTPSADGEDPQALPIGHPTPAGQLA
jgi:transposase InsO family protein